MGEPHKTRKLIYCGPSAVGIYRCIDRACLIMDTSPYQESEALFV